MQVKKMTDDGFEQVFQINHLAHFLFFQLLKPLLLSSSTPSFHSRVVDVSSSAHTMASVQLDNYSLEKPFQHPWDSQFAMKDSDFNCIVAYGQSKTANIWMSNEIERVYGPQGVHGFSLHPGIVHTNGLANIDPSVMEILGPLMGDPAMLPRHKNVEQGAATTVIAAIAKAFEGKGGFYLDNCGISPALKDGEMGVDGGFRPYAYDRVDGEKQLWADSLKMVGLKE